MPLVRTSRQTTQHVPITSLPTVNGLDRSLAAIDVDPPVFEQKLRFDAPSLTIYMGTNKIALIPALLSAILVKLILFGGAKVSQTFVAPDGKSAKAARA